MGERENRILDSMNKLMRMINIIPSHDEQIEYFDTVEAMLYGITAEIAEEHLVEKINTNTNNKQTLD